MAMLEHLWSLTLFLLILVGPTSLCLSLLLVNRKETGGRAIAHSFLIVTAGWSIIQVSLGLLLGTFHKLSLYPILLSELSLFFIGLMMLLGYQKHLGSFSIKSYLKIRANLCKYEQLMISSILLIGIITFYKLSVYPIIEFDSLSFHLPAIARWYQTGSLTLLDSAGHWIFSHHDAIRYPYNWHILSVLFIQPFKEDFWVALPMLIAWIMLGISVYLLSLLLRASRLYALATTSLLLTIPFILDQVNTIHVDLPFAALFVTSLYFILSYFRTQASSEIFLCFASLGMLAGIKTPGLIYGGFLLTILIGLKTSSIISCLKRPHSIKCKEMGFINPLIYVGLVFFLYLGGFWYFKNVWEIKNYIADLCSSVTASTEVFLSPEGSGFYNLQKSTLTSQFDPKNIYNWKTLAEQSVARLQLPFLIMLVQVLWLPFFCLRGSRRDRRYFTGIFILVLVTGFLYWNTPYSSGTSGEFPGQISPLIGNNFRYGFPFISMLSVAAAVVTTRLQVPKQCVVLLVILSSILSIVSSTGAEIARTEAFVGAKVFWISRILNESGFEQGKLVDLVQHFLKNSFAPVCVYIASYSSILLVIYLRLFRKLAYPKFINYLCRVISRQKIASICVCVSLTIAMSWVMREQRDIHRTYVYKGIYEYLDANIKPNENIGYFSSSRSYLFYGQALDRQVLNLSVLPNASNQWLNDQWFNELRQNNVVWVAIGPLTQKSPLLKKSISTVLESGSLVKVFGNDFENEPTLYRLKTN